MAEKIPKSASLRLSQHFTDPDALEAERQRIAVKKAAAAAIVFRHVAEKKDLATAFFEVYPEVEISRSLAKRRAGRLVKWFRINFPVAMRQLLFLKGFDDDRIIDLVSDQLKATILVKKRTRKFKDGGNWVEEHEFIEVADNRTRADALQKLILLGGHHARRANAPNEADAKASEPRDVTNSTNTVKIGTRPKLPPDEWQRQYQEAMKESNASGRADKMIRDIERRVAEAEAANGEATHSDTTPGLPYSPPER